MSLLHQFHKLSLAHDCVTEIETGKLNLLRVTIAIQFIKKPVIQWAVVLKFESADRMRDPLHGIRKAMGEIVHRVDAPLVACPVVCCPQNAVYDRITHIQVAGCHVNLCPKHMRSVFKLACAHPLKQVKVFLD